MRAGEAFSGHQGPSQRSVTKSAVGRTSTRCQTEMEFAGSISLETVRQCTQKNRTQAGRSSQNEEYDRERPVVCFERVTPSSWSRTLRRARARLAL